MPRRGLIALRPRAARGCSWTRPRGQGPVGDRLEGDLLVAEGLSTVPFRRDGEIDLRAGTGLSRRGD